MIKTEQLTKRYDSLTAVDDVSFHVGPGEVLGFLGPNGAGKTTTMRMLAGFVTPTSGRANICGHDVESEPLKAKAALGYLPEGAPLYGEMTVRRFLEFIADLRSLTGARRSQRLGHVIEHLPPRGVHPRDHHLARPHRGRRHADRARRTLALPQCGVHAARAAGAARRSARCGGRAPGGRRGRGERARCAAHRAPQGRRHHPAGSLRARRAGGAQAQGAAPRVGTPRRGVPDHHRLRTRRVMRNVGIIMRRELASYFATPLAYVFIVIFLFLANVFTFYLGHLYESGQADLYPFFTFHPWLYLFLIPAISMKLWSEERKSGSIELLMTQPVELSEAVLGKFLAAWIFTALALALTFPLWITVNYLGHPDNGAILTAYLGSIMLAGGFLAIGSCMSALTRNQVVAFILAVVTCFMF